MANKLHAARKKLALKIRAQTIGHDRHMQIICDARQLPDLLFGEELRFIDKHAGNFTCQRATRLKVANRSSSTLKGNRLRFKPDTRRNPATPGAIIEGRNQDNRAHAALLIIVGCLQQHGRFSGIHCRVTEIEFGHGNYFTR